MINERTKFSLCEFRKSLTSAQNKVFAVCTVRCTKKVNNVFLGIVAYNSRVQLGATVQEVY